MDKGFQGPYTKEDGFLGYNEVSLSCENLRICEIEILNFFADLSRIDGQSRRLDDILGRRGEGSLHAERE